MLPGFEEQLAEWQDEFHQHLPDPPPIHNRSGVPIEPLYTPADWNGESYLDALGFPGKPPFTRGIYATMHRGRRWTQRQLVGDLMDRAFGGSAQKLVLRALSEKPASKEELDAIRRMLDELEEAGS